MVAQGRWPANTDQVCIAHELCPSDADADIDIIDGFNMVFPRLSFLCTGGGDLTWAV